MKNIFKNIGPGPLVAAAFVGPGTVTLCTLAGVEFGFELLWALLLSIIATIVLQEMSVRVGLIQQKGIASVVKTALPKGFIKTASLILILSAIAIGNTAYEAGNISGGVLGLENLFGTFEIEIAENTINLFPVIIGLCAFMLLYLGSYKVLEKWLVALVLLMSIAFVVTAIITKPNIMDVLQGLFKPSFESDRMLMVIGLVGTTVVPYNLFLHASLVKEKWKHPSDLKAARIDTYLAVILGGIVSMCILIAAAAMKGQSIANAADLALALEPLFGNYASMFLACGLFAAGITSAITAPLAAAYVTAGCLGWSTDLKSKGFRAVWMIILFVGVVFASIGIKPIELIKFAQVSNGILLPIIAIFLLWIVNKASVLGNYKNNLLQNIFGIVIILIAVFLGGKSILKVFGAI